LTELARRLVAHRRRFGNVDGILSIIRKLEWLEQVTAVRMWVCTHAPIAARGERCQLRHQPAIFVEQLFRHVAPHPHLELCKLLWVRARRRQWNLMRAERPFDGLSIHDCRTCPALWRAEHNRGPPRPIRDLWRADGPRPLLNVVNALEARIQH